MAIFAFNLDNNKGIVSLGRYNEHINFGIDWGV